MAKQLVLSQEHMETGKPVTLLDIPINTWRMCRRTGSGALLLSVRSSDTEAKVIENLGTQTTYAVHPFDLHVVDSKLRVIRKQPPLPATLEFAPAGSFWQVESTSEVYALVGSSRTTLFDANLNQKENQFPDGKLIPIRYLGRLLLQEE